MTIKSQVKQIAREVIASSGKKSKYRLANVVQLNSDGTCNAIVDGNSVVASPLYPVVAGQQVVLMYGTDGTISAVPTSPNTDSVNFEHPPFFSGGFIRFCDGRYIQQAFNSTTYQITDLPTYSDRGSYFSPDGTRLVIILVKSGQTDVHYRVYNLGQKLQAGAVIDPVNNIVTLNNPLLFEVIRTMNWEMGNGLGVAVFKGEVNNNVIGVDESWLAALDDNPSQLYWAEHEIPFDPTPTTGFSVEIVHLYNLVSSTPTQIAQWTVAFADVNTPSDFISRSVFWFGNAHVSSTIQRTHNTGIFDALSGELVGVHSSPFLSDNIISSALAGHPTVYSIMNPTNAPYNFTSFGAYPAGTTSNGANILLSTSAALVGGSPPFGSSCCRTKRFNTITFQAYADTSFNLEDFTRLFYENTGTLAKAEAKFTNSIAGDASVGPGLAFMMSSVTNGLFVDQVGHVRKTTSADNGVTFTIDSTPANYLKISPGTANPTVIRLIALNLATRKLQAVSTL